MSEQDDRVHRFRELKMLTMAFSLLLIASVCLVAGLVTFSIRSQDAVAVRDSERLLRSILLDRKERLRDQIIDYSYWDEAVHQLIVRRNPVWADANVGIYMHDRFGIDASYVVAPDGTTTYAMVDGQRVETLSPFDTFGGEFETLLERARSSPADEPPMPVTGYLSDPDGEIFLTAVSILSTFAPDEKGNLGTGWVLVFQRKIDEAFLSSLSERYLLTNLTLTSSPDESFHGRMVLVSPVGDPIGLLAWQVDSEFAQTMNWLAPFLLLTFLVFGVLAIVFFTRSRQILEVLSKNLSALGAAQSERNQALVQAKSASQAKSRFLANMSHELRTPLNAIIGMCDMMRHGAFGDIGNERYADYLNDVHSSARHLLRLINDVLDISAIEAGKLKLKFEEVHIDRIFSDGLAVIRQAAEDKGVTFETHTAANLPPITADQRSLTQILVNLLNNAVKYTPVGGHVYLDADVDTTDHIFVVRDTGMGIPPEVLPQITEPFIRAHDDPGLAIEGTGLGLSITKELLHAHRGSLKIESEIDVGTRVTVRIPRDSHSQIDLFTAEDDAAKQT